MRKLVALLLLAGTAAPAMAATDPGDRHGWQSHAGQQSTSDNQDNHADGNDRPRGSRSNRDGGRGNDAQQHSQQPMMRVAPSGGGNNDQPQPMTQVQSNAGDNSSGHRQFNGIRSRFSSGNEQPAIQPSGHDDGKPADTVRTWRGPKIVEPSQVSTEDRARGALREQHRSIPTVLRNRVPIISNTPHEGTQPPLRVDSRSRDRNHHWDTSWRSNHHYDWQDWRRHHRSHFHLGLYYDPFGWSYQPYQIGWRLWPNYYGSRYWISDPWEYRLPYAPPGYRWIRYWDDALLVDTFTGEVVDVIPNFFW